MEFGDQIKSIRKNEGLTQEQLAAKLNVSRQAVSNWENNKNLPDIELLISMSDIFNVSLDQLIKGDRDMNNYSTMTEKVINDAGETKRAKYNMIVSVIGSVLIALGILLLAIKGMSVEYIDADGILHENFFFLPMAFVCLISGMAAFVATGLKVFFARFKKN